MPAMLAPWAFALHLMIGSILGRGGPHFLRAVVVHRGVVHTTRVHAMAWMYRERLAGHQKLGRGQGNQ